MGRNKTTPIIRRVTQEVTKLQRGPLSPSMGSGRGAAPGPSYSRSLQAIDPITDETYTIHTFILGVDTLGDRQAALRVRGEFTRDYGA
jgi:hypothetical protein